MRSGLVGSVKTADPDMEDGLKSLDLALFDDGSGVRGEEMTTTSRISSSAGYKRDIFLVLVNVMCAKISKEWVR